MIKTEGHYNELSFIYDPISQTLSSIENNPVPEKFISAGGGQMWVEDAPGVDKIGPGSYGRGIHSYLLATERGDILFFQISPELPDVILATAFDSKSKSYKPVRGDTKVTSFNIKSCGVDDKPILLNDGRIFLQSAIISSDLSNVIQIDPPNIEGKKCFHTSYHFGGYGSISLPNSNVLFLSDKHSFIFDGDKYRDTKYQPPQFTGNGTRPTMYHDWDYEEQRRRIIIMPGSELTVLRIEFVY